MLFLLLDKEPASTVTQSAEAQFKKQVEDTLRSISGPSAITGEVRLIIPAGISGDTAKLIVEDSIKTVPALKGCTVQAGNKQVTITPPANQQTESPAPFSLPLSTVPTVNVTGTPSVDWTGLVKKYMAPAVCIDDFIGTDRNGISRQVRREYVPAAPGQTVELLQNTNKVGEAQVGPDQCIMTYYYSSGGWVPFQRQLAPADQAMSVNVGKTVQEGLNLALEQLGGSSKSKKSGSANLTDYQLQLLSYQLYFNFKTYTVLESNTTTPRSDDFFTTKTPSWGQVLGGIEASNLAKADKEFIKTKLKEYYSSGAVVQTGTAGPMSLSGSLQFVADSITDYILPANVLQGLPGYLPSSEFTSPNDTETPTQFLQYKRYALSKQFSDLLSPFAECLKGEVQYTSIGLGDMGQTRYTIKPKWIEVGMTSSGQPYAVLDPETYQKVMGDNGPLMSRSFAPPYGGMVVARRPDDGFPLFNGERKDGNWNVAFNLKGPTDAAFVNAVLEPAFGPNRYDMLNLADEASSPRSAVRTSIVTKCGRVSDQQLLADPEFSPVLHINSVRKMEANGGFLVGQEWSEWQSFYSILGYCRELHPLTFGVFSVDSPMLNAQGGGTGRVVRVIDERTGIMGEAPLAGGDNATQAEIRAASREAVRSMSHNIFAARGFYDIYEKSSGKPATSSTQHYSFGAVYETPAYRGIIRDVGGALSFGLASGNPVVAGIGLTGWLASNVEKAIGREERRLHTGEGYGGMDYADMATQAFILTLRLPLWWTRATAVEGTASAAEKAVGGALVGGKVLSTGRLFTHGSASMNWWFGGAIALAIAADTSAEHIGGEQEYAKANLDGRPLASTIRPADAASVMLARLPKDADPATFSINSFVYETWLTPLFSEGYGSPATVEQVKKEWGSALNRALLSSEPYGEPMPNGLSDHDAGAWQSIMLVRNAMWIENHKPFVRELAKKLNWSLGDTYQAILMYGGPRIEHTAIETLAAIRTAPASTFGSAAASLSTFSPQSKARFTSGALEDDLKVQFMTSHIRLSEIKP